MVKYIKDDRPRVLWSYPQILFVILKSYWIFFQILEWWTIQVWFRESWISEAQNIFWWGNSWLGWVLLEERVESGRNRLCEGGNKGENCGILLQLSQWWRRVFLLSRLCHRWKVEKKAGKTTDYRSCAKMIKIATIF